MLVSLLLARRAPGLKCDLNDVLVRERRRVVPVFYRAAQEGVTLLWQGA